MTAHELARKLLEGPDFPVWGNLESEPVEKVELCEFLEDPPFISLSSQ